LDDLAERTEKSLLLKLRPAVWAMVFTAVIMSFGAIGFTIFQYSQSVEISKPLNRPQVTSVKAEGFLQQLAQKEDYPSGTSFENERSKSTLPLVKANYLDEAKKIVECSRNSNARSGLDTTAFTPQLAQTFQHELQGVAESSREQRGVLYVADAVRFFCEVMSNTEVIAYKKNNSEVQLFDSVINYHLNQWDRLQENSVRIRQDEQQSVLNATVKEEIRVAKVQMNTLGALSVVGSSLGLLMAAMLYFVLARTELRINSVYQMVASLNLNTMQQKPSSEFSELPLQGPPPEVALNGAIDQGS
jgi:hypothetical protein